MLNDISWATVIVVDQTHAVALWYVDWAGNAPIVVAKGTEEIAQRIRQIASEKNIPMIEQGHLAGNLFAKADVGEGIPGVFFPVVAEVLAEVYRLSKRGID